MMDKVTLTETIKKMALSLGFDAVGIAPAQELREDASILSAWLEKGNAATMNYMHHHFEKRTNPSLLIENTRSVIVVLYHYFPEKQQASNKYKIAKYAYGRDYHFIIKSKLQELAKQLPHLDPSMQTWFCDSAPVLERRWAQLAGLGWIGKNGCLINNKLGSYVFIGELLTDIELVYDEPDSESHCGSCTRCLTACPTKALSSPYALDANKCISYHTIENREDIPAPIAENTQGYIFGCDICQDVCPWNNKVVSLQKPELTSLPYVDYTDSDWEKVEKTQFKQDFLYSPIQRAGYKKLKKNVNT